MNVSTDDLLIYKIQKVIPFWTASLSTTSLVIHSMIAIIFCPLYAVIIYGIFKRRNTNEFSSVFFRCVIISGIIDILFFLDHFFTGTCCLFSPYASFLAPTTPTLWLGPIYFLGFFFAYSLDWLALYISINRFFMILFPIKAKEIFERTFIYSMIMIAIFVTIPAWFHIINPAYFILVSNVYTNNMPICTFTNVLPKGWEQVPTRNSVLLLACLSGATLIMNLMTFAAIFYRIRGHHVKKTEIKMAVYSIFLFLSQQSYTCVFYTGYFGGSLPDLSINYFAKVIKPWAYVIFCLTPAVSLICLSKNVRSIVREAIRGQMIGSQNKVGSTMIRTVKETVLPVPKKLNRV